MEKVNEKWIEKLPETFNGKGEVKGYSFRKIKENEACYLYETSSNNKRSHYEVIEKRLTPVCLDFDNKVYSTTEFKERKPKAKDFGVWAWTFSNIKTAITKMQLVEESMMSKKNEEK